MKCEIVSLALPAGVSPRLLKIYKSGEDEHALQEVVEDAVVSAEQLHARQNRESPPIDLPRLRPQGAQI